ncbi:heme-binding protein [Paenibacillus sp. JTLBN-2024]
MSACKCRRRTCRKRRSLAEPSYGINTTNRGRVVILAGGIPLKVGEQIVGGIGVSGGTSVQDAEIANAAVQAFQAMQANPGGNVNVRARIGSVRF